MEKLKKLKQRFERLNLVEKLLSLSFIISTLLLVIIALQLLYFTFISPRTNVIDIENMKELRKCGAIYALTLMSIAAVLCLDEENRDAVFRWKKKEKKDGETQ